MSSTELRLKNLELCSAYFVSFLNSVSTNLSMEEVISIATGLMKDKMEEFIQPIKATAQEKEQLAEEAINEEFNRIQEIISSVAPEVQSISSKIHFEVKEKVSDIMVQKLQSDGFI